MTLKTEREKSAIEEESFAKLIPVSGFFADYMDYTSLQESPGSFHFWTAATIIGVALGRRAWVDKGAYLVYPNLFTVLVAPTGECSKSTAMNMGTNLLAGSRWVNVIADKTTPEGMLESLMYGTGPIPKEHEPLILPDSCGLIKASELAVFLSRASYSQDMISVLTTLYDCLPEWIYRTRNKKEIRLHNIAVSFLGASTPDWLASALPKDAFGGGFMSRFIFVVKQESDRRIIMVKNDTEKRVRALKDQLVKLYASARGEVKLTQDALDWYTNWYYTSKAEPLMDENLRGFARRKQDIIIKLAIILAASHYYDIIDLSTMQQAYNIVTWAQKRAFEAFKFVGLSTLGSLKEQIVTFIRDKGGEVTRGDVTRRFSRQFVNGMKDLDAIEQVWTSSEEVLIKNTITHNRPGKVYSINE
jgi:hypothetical protein